MAARARTSLHFKSATSVGEIKILLMLTWNKVNEPSTTPKTGGRQKKKQNFIIYLSQRGENEDCGTHTRLVLKARITKASMTSSSWFFVHNANDCLSPWEIVPPIEGKWIPSFSDTFFWNINSRWHAKKRFDNKSQLAACFFRDCGYQMHEKRERKGKKKQIIIAFELQSSQRTLERENNNIFKDNKTIDFVFGNTTFPRRNRGQHSFFFLVKRM